VELASEEQWRNFRFIEGDTRDKVACRQAIRFTPVDEAFSTTFSGEDVGEYSNTPIDYVLHQADLGSVPRSIEDPATTHDVNVNGFVNMLIAARDAGVRRFVYAASSSVYGDEPDLPKQEDRTGRPLSPYALTKRINEEYADIFARTYGMETIGLRYFNVFGPRQDPNGPYAAVVPLWFHALANNEVAYINGDGETSRDFCYVDNAVQANLLAATSINPKALNRAYNVAVGERTSLNQLFVAIRDLLAENKPEVRGATPVYRDFRPGDVRHSLADIERAAQLLGYQPVQTLGIGLREAKDWYNRRPDKQRCKRATSHRDHRHRRVTIQTQRRFAPIGSTSLRNGWDTTVPTPISTDLTNTTNAVSIAYYQTLVQGVAFRWWFIPP